jgi:hypothetical protein
MSPVSYERLCSRRLLLARARGGDRVYCVHSVCESILRTAVFGEGAPIGKIPMRRIGACPWLKTLLVVA